MLKVKKESPPDGRRGSSLRRKVGQAMTEYMIVAATLVLAVAILAVFLYTLKEHGGRVFDLVASEYP